MKQSEVIVRVGAAGGDLTLFGIRTSDGWFFSLKAIDQTPELLNEPWVQYNSETVDSWSDALELLDRYPWHKLSPLIVHPEFQEMVFDAVVARYKSKNDIDPRRLSSWGELCGMSGD